MITSTGFPVAITDPTYACRSNPSWTITAGCSRPIRDEIVEPPRSCFVNSTQCFPADRALCAICRASVDFPQFIVP